MEPKDIHELIEILSESNLSSVEIEREGFRLKLVKKAPVAAAVPETTQPVAHAMTIEVPPPVAGAPAAQPEVTVDPGLFEQTTPFVGTYYSAPNPEADPFVSVGTHVKKGDVLCIVEAMKLMNEIEADTGGEVVEALVQNGQPVEYGEVLFRIRPA